MHLETEKFCESLIAILALLQCSGTELSVSQVHLYRSLVCLTYHITITIIIMLKASVQSKMYSCTSYKPVQRESH